MRRPPVQPPRRLTLRDWLAVLRRGWRGIGRDRIGLAAAGVAFYGLLSLFPAIAASLAVAGLATDPAWVVDEFQHWSEILPDEAGAIILAQAEAVAGSGERGLGLTAALALLLAFFAASRGLSGLIDGLNIAWHVHETRGFIRVAALRLGLTLMLILGVLAAASVSVVIPAVLAYLGQVAGGLTAGARVAGLVSWLGLLALGMFGLAVLNRFGPARTAPSWHWITPGAAVAVIVWVAGSAGFATYVTHFGSYNKTFGALGGVVVLLLWLWLSAYIVLLGARLDAEVEMQRALPAA